jgi:hypothetical protein
MVDRRKEPRFQVYAWAKVSPLDTPERVTEGHVVDISGIGLRLITDVAFEADQMIVVETDQHLILADVRNCNARGNRFSVGAERVHSAAKVAIPESGSAAERNEALVQDYRRHLLNELPKVEPAARPISNGSARTPVEPHVRSFPFEAPVSAPQRHQTATMLAEPQPQPLAAAKPEELKLHLLNPSPFQSSPLIVSSKLDPVHDAFESAERDEPVAEPSATIVPDDSVRQMFLEPTPADVKTGSSRRKILVAALCATAAVALIVFGPTTKRLLFPAPAAARSAPVAVPTSTPAPTPAPVPVPPVATFVAPSESELATPVPVPATSGETHVSITTSESSWVTACSDGKVLFTKIMPRGGMEEFGFSKRGLVRLGNAGPVEVLLNGKSIGSLGRKGQLRAIELTPESFNFLLLRAPDGCTQ